MAMTEQAVSTEQAALPEMPQAKWGWDARRQGEPTVAQRQACATRRQA